MRRARSLMQPLLTVAGGQRTRYNYAAGFSVRFEISEIFPAKSQNRWLFARSATKTVFHHGALLTMLASWDAHKIQKRLIRRIIPQLTSFNIISTWAAHNQLLFQFHKILPTVTHQKPALVMLSTIDQAAKLQGRNSQKIQMKIIKNRD